MDNAISACEFYTTALRETALRDGIDAALQVAATTIAFYYEISSGGTIRDGRPLLTGVTEVHSEIER